MDARRISLALLGLAACSHPSPTSLGRSVSVPSRTAADRGSIEMNDDEDEIIILEDMPANSPRPGSYLLRSPAVVRDAPRPDATMLGVLAVGTRLPKADPVSTERCRGGWVSVEPRGYACIALETSKRDPAAVAQPVVRRGSKLPTVYGKVRRTARIYPDIAAAREGRGEPSSVSLTVERRGATSVDGREFWRTRHGLIARTDIRRLTGSTFAGVSLGADAQLPIVWTIPGERRTVAVHRKPSLRARRSGRMPAFSVLADADLQQDHDFVHVPERGWIARDDVRVATASSPPEDLAADELWIDVDLSQQTLVAYRDSTPVFATLVSTGKARYETPTGEFRIQRKMAMRTMNSRPGARESYAVDKVPWTAYFKGSYAFHTAYWHAGFGRVRSHGCINLSPSDAHQLYDWMGPHAAPGWRDVYATEAHPGTRVRIRKSAATTDR